MKDIGKPDLILIEGKIVTVDDEDSLVEAVAIKNGKIVATGTSDEISNLAGSKTRIVDLEGKTAMPGIIDSHTHPSSIASR